MAPGKPTRSAKKRNNKGELKDSQSEDKKVSPELEMPKAGIARGAKTAVTLTQSGEKAVATPKVSDTTEDVVAEGKADSATKRKLAFQVYDNPDEHGFASKSQEDSKKSVFGNGSDTDEDEDDDDDKEEKKESVTSKDKKPAAIKKAPKFDPTALDDEALAKYLSSSLEDAAGEDDKGKQGVASTSTLAASSTKATIFGSDSDDDEQIDFNQVQDRVVLYGPYCMGSFVLGEDKKIDSKATKWVYIGVFAGGFSADGTVRHHFNNHMTGKQVLVEGSYMKNKTVRNLKLSPHNLVQLVDSEQKPLRFTQGMDYGGLNVKGFVMPVVSEEGNEFKAPDEETALEYLVQFASLQNHLQKTPKMKTEHKKIEVDTSAPNQHLLNLSHPYHKHLYELVGTRGIIEILDLVHGKRQMLAKSVGKEKKYPLGKVVGKLEKAKRNTFLNLRQSMDPKRVNEKAIRDIMPKMKWPKKLCKEFDMYNESYMEPSFLQERRTEARLRAEQEGGEDS